MSEKKLCTCEPNWVCENCQTIEKLQQEISRLKNKIIHAKPTIKVSELREWCEGRIAICTKTKTSDNENELQCRSYHDVIQQFCEVKK